MNVIRIISETGLRVYQELAPMRKDQVDLENAVAWIPESKTPNGVAEVPLTEITVEAFRRQMVIAGAERGYFHAVLSQWLPTELQEGLEHNPAEGRCPILPLV